MTVWTFSIRLPVFVIGIFMASSPTVYGQTVGSNTSPGTAAVGTQNNPAPKTIPTSAVANALPPKPAAPPAPNSPPSTNAANGQKAQPALPPLPAVSPPDSGDLLSGIIEEFNFDPAANKRDPFTQYMANKPEVFAFAAGPVLPLQRFDIDKLRLVGIIWGVKSPKALVEDPQGKSHIISINDRIGRNNGYVATIREGEIVVIEAGNTSNPVIRLIKMPKGKEASGL